MFHQKVPVPRFSIGELAVNLRRQQSPLNLHPHTQKAPDSSVQAKRDTIISAATISTTKQRGIK